MCHVEHMSRVVEYEAAVRQAVAEVQRREAQARLLREADRIAAEAWVKPSLVAVGAATSGLSALVGVALFAVAKVAGA